MSPFAARQVVDAGDHTIALPLLRAVAAKHGPVAVVHLDAHLDTWDTYFGAVHTLHEILSALSPRKDS
ncbi:arginase family protein [Actinoplanes philippinensis]|uniref:arginase family protein n=1 Tax=Actinoplanes philippinensis TaxID=35752 RepID=UPI0033F59679